MLDSILNASSVDDLTKIARELLFEDKRVSLHKETQSRSMILLSEHMMTEEQVSVACSSDKTVFATLSKACGAEKFVQVLQIVAHLNPGVSKFIEKFLDRSCI